MTWINTRMLLWPLLFGILLGVLDRTIRRDKEMKGGQYISYKICLLMTMKLFGENPKESTEVSEIHEKRQPPELHFCKLILNTIRCPVLSHSQRKIWWGPTELEGVEWALKCFENGDGDSHGTTQMCSYLLTAHFKMAKVRNSICVTKILIGKGIKCAVTLWMSLSRNKQSRSDFYHVFF